MVLADSSVLFDVLADDPIWRDWSLTTLRENAVREGIAINPLVFAEIAPQFPRPRTAEQWLADYPVKLLELPYEAAFLAGNTHARYRRAGGDKRSPMPDFYIGAHAQILGLKLLTRDVRRFRTYFPDVELIAPPGL